jgi:SAM-dependent methyltransferase
LRVTDQRERILDQFTRQAAPFASAPSIRDEKALQLVVAETGVGADDRVLDVACGPGLLACAFARVARDVVGIDLVPAMLDQARSHQAALALGNVIWRLGDVEPLPFEDASFDVVTCRYAVHHFANPIAVVREMARVCRPGGRVTVVDVAASPDPAKARAFNQMEVWRDPSHVRALPETELLELFAAAELPPSRRAAYLLETELEAVLGRSFPGPGDAERVREAVTATVLDDRLGVPARRDGDQVIFGYPVVVLSAVKERRIVPGRSPE